MREERGSGRRGGWRRRRLKEREKGTVFHSPSNVLSVKTSRLCFSALHSTAPQPLRLMAVLADPNTTPSLWQGQVGSKRIRAFNQTVRDAAECLLVFIKWWFLFCYTKDTSLYDKACLWDTILVWSCTVLRISGAWLDLPWFNVKGVTVILNCLSKGIV